MPKCKINGKEIEVKSGTTIIEAFKQSGQDICHYCWHPGLSVAGVCRLCMVEIEGNPKLQIACNTVVQEGMVINNNSEKVKDTVKWGLDFHLINHPLDCPICDQAGECGLQDQYMQFGKYDPEMAERKVKKRKVVSLGERVVLDSERCILCSRCVRFTNEVTKTNELGIFNRGDHSEIGTFHDKPLNNNYSLNTVDICPVGALTSKDFRFRQRVWYLKEGQSICNGCSTGCNVKAYHNEEGVFRVKPVQNDQVNGYWMCDEGRDIYKYVNPKARLLSARVGENGSYQERRPEDVARETGRKLKELAEKHGADSVGLVLTGQQSNEEYKDLLDWFTGRLGSKQVFHWINNPEKFDDFDGILLRGDRNPNTKGLLDAMAERKLQATWKQLEESLAKKSLKALVVVGPENVAVFPDFAEKVKLLSQAPELVWLTSVTQKSLDDAKTHLTQIPLKSYLEKDGTFINYKGMAQQVKRVTTLVAEALTGSEVAALFSGAHLDEAARPESEEHLKTNYFVYQRGAL